MNYYSFGGGKAFPTPVSALVKAEGNTLSVLSSASVEPVIEFQPRLVISTTDVTEKLNAFARRWAREVVNFWDAPDVVEVYLRTGTETIREEAHKAAAKVRWDSIAADAAWQATREPELGYIAAYMAPYYAVVAESNFSGALAKAVLRLMELQFNTAFGCV